MASGRAETSRDRLVTAFAARLNCAHANRAVSERMFSSVIAGPVLRFQAMAILFVKLA
jgi:hypothetical protein